MLRLRPGFVSWNRANSGQVQIVLEETRQRVLSGDVDDDGIRTLLLRAARESSDPGVRVETMDLLKGQPQSAGRANERCCMLFEHDTNAGVRLKALEALRPSAARFGDSAGSGGGPAEG